MLLGLLQESDDPTIPMARDAAAYAAATREVAKETGATIVDVWTAFAEKAGWKEGDKDLPGMQELGENAELADLLSDGKLSTEIWHIAAN